MYPFRDRVDAGKKLAERLISDFKGKPDTVVIGLPRGGVVLADEVATALELPLDIVVPRKIGAPMNPELAVGAITEDGEVQLDEEVLKYLGIDHSELSDIIEQERIESARRVKVYRGDRPPLNKVIEKKTAIIVDDGIATGATVKAAIKSLRSRKAKSIVVAVPVGAASTMIDIQKLADLVITLETPYNFRAVGQFYKYFNQTSDEEVIHLMKKHKSVPISE